MRTWTETSIHREGTNMGPVDYDFPFLKHFSNHCVSEETKLEMCNQAIEFLRKADEGIKAGKLVRVRVGDYWYIVVEVCMYDGWPFWTPTPALRVENRVFTGTDWKFYYELSAVDVR